MPKRKIYKPNFFFNTLKYFEDLIFNAVMNKHPSQQLAYFIYLRDKCNKQIDIVLMKNNKKEIFKLLDAIDNNGD